MPVVVPIHASVAPILRSLLVAFLPPPCVALLEIPSQIPLARSSSMRLSSNRTDFDFTKNRNEKSPFIDSGFGDPFNQYGSHLNHDEEGSSISKKNLYTPGRQHSLF